MKKTERSIQIEREFKQSQLKLRQAIVRNRRAVRALRNESGGLTGKDIIEIIKTPIFTFRKKKRR